MPQLPVALADSLATTFYEPCDTGLVIADASWNNLRLIIGRGKPVGQDARHLSARAAGKALRALPMRSQFTCCLVIWSYASASARRVRCTRWNLSLVTDSARSDRLTDSGFQA